MKKWSLLILIITLVVMLATITSHAQGYFGSDGAFHPRGKFPIVLSNETKGGLHRVLDTAERDAIGVDFQEDGMLVYVRSERKTYQLLDDQWVEFGGGGEVPTLQQVTSAGNHTMDSLVFGSDAPPISLLDIYGRDAGNFVHFFGNPDWENNMVEMQAGYFNQGESIPDLYTNMRVAGGSGFTVTSVEGPRHTTFNLDRSGFMGYSESHNEAGNNGLAGVESLVVDEENGTVPEGYVQILAGSPELRLGMVRIRHGRVNMYSMDSLNLWGSTGILHGDEDENVSGNALFYSLHPEVNRLELLFGRMLDTHGFRDHDGTMQYKNAGGEWTDVGMQSSVTTEPPYYTLWGGAGVHSRAEVTGVDIGGTVTLTTGDALTTDDSVIEVHFRTPLNAPPRTVLIQGVNATARADEPLYYTDQTTWSGDGFVIRSIGTLKPNTTYVIAFSVIR